MNRNSKMTLVVFTRQENDSELLGFSAMNPKRALQYLKAVDALSEHGAVFMVGANEYEYSSEDFSKINVTQNDLSILQKMFDIELDEQARGIFPDAFTDVYDLGLSDEYEEDEDL